MMSRDPQVQQPESGRPTRRRQLLLLIALLACGGGGTYLLIISRKPVRRAEHKALAPLVETIPLRVGDITMTVRGYGTVNPVVQLEIVPQVSGKVVWVNPRFRAGGSVKAGEVLIRIDPRDYALAARQAEAAVADAQVMLEKEQAEAMVAREEWRRIHPNSQPDSPLVFRQPQVHQAKAAVEAAKATLAEARLALERTELSLAVDAVITAKRCDLGQFVTAGQSIGSAYGTDLFEIEVPLEDKELAWFDVPGESASAAGRQEDLRCDAVVRADFAGASHTWHGKVTRTTGQVDTASRLVTVVVEVARPRKVDPRQAPLLPGTFVEVEIEGKTVHDALAVPRDAVHNGNEIWVVNGGRLYIRRLDIIRTDENSAYALDGFGPGDELVVSSLDAVTDGMQVRVRPASLRDQQEQEPGKQP